MTKQIYK